MIGASESVGAQGSTHTRKMDGSTKQANNGWCVRSRVTARSHEKVQKNSDLQDTRTATNEVQDDEEAPGVHGPSDRRRVERVVARTALKS